MQQTASSFDHLVGEQSYCVGNRQSERLCGLEIDQQLESARLHDRKIPGLRTLENARCIDTGLTVHVPNVRAVADQAASDDIIPLRVHRRNTQTGRQSDYVLAPVHKEGISTDE